VSKFCVNCGKKLSDNQTCDCTLTRWDTDEFKEDSMVNMDSSNNPYYTTKFSSSNNNLKNPKSKLDFFKYMLKITIEYLKNPHNTLSEYSYSKDKSIIIFFISIQAIIASLFTTFSIKNLLKYSLLKLHSSDKTIKIAYETIDNNKLSFTDYFNTFNKTLLTYIMLSIIFAAILKFIVKKEEQLFPLLTTLSLNSIPITISIILTFLTFNIFNLYIPLIGVFFVFSSILLSSILTYDLLRDSIKFNQEYITYIVILILGLYYFVLLNPVLKLF
jgi:hypothetical protein